MDCFWNALRQHKAGWGAGGMAWIALVEWAAVRVRWVRESHLGGETEGKARAESHIDMSSADGDAPVPPRPPSHPHSPSPMQFKQGQVYKVPRPWHQAPPKANEKKPTEEVLLLLRDWCLCSVVSVAIDTPD